MGAERDRPAGRGGRTRPARTSIAERRELRSAVDDPAELMDRAARFLEARQRSVAEVRRKLTGLGYRPALVEEVLTRLEELRYLDDEAFARAWVESRDRASPRGELALRQELRQRGVPRDIVETVLEERQLVAAGVDAGGSALQRGTPATDAGDEEAGPRAADEAAARRLLEKRGSMFRREADPRRRRQRAYALLARSGFTPDVCSSVSQLVLEPGSADDEADLMDGPGGG